MAETPSWQLSSRKRAEVAAIAGLGYPILRTLGSTWKWRVSGAEHVDAIAAGDHFELVLTRWPVITQHPQSLAVNQGASASFSVTAAGAGPRAFQWQKNRTNIAGATSTNLDQ